MDPKCQDESYPLFIPPFPLFKTKAAGWTEQESITFFNWLLSISEPRIQGLLRFMSESVPSDEQEWPRFLLELGRKYSDRLFRAPFCRLEEGLPKLTNEGAALAADCGLLVARLLTTFAGSKIHWELLKDPGAFSHNRPILRGFQGDLYFDPIAGNLYEARALLGRKKTHTVLHDIFVFWKGKMA